MGLGSNPVLFYTLFGLSVAVAVTLITLTCWCLIRRRRALREKKVVEKVTAKYEVSSQANLDYATGLRQQQVPLHFKEPRGDFPKSSPSSPTRSPVAARRHSFDLKTLDLEMYKREEEASRVSPYLGLGRLCFSVYYDTMNEKLVVSLIRGTRLPSKTGSLTPSPYVKLTLLPDKKRKHQSRTIKGSNPDFNEEFVYLVPVSEIETKLLKLTVCDYDRFSRTSVIGYVLFPLGDYLKDITRIGGTGDLWREIAEDEVLPGEDKGELLFSMSHLPTAGRLTINVMKGKGIRTQERDSHAGLAVKVSMISGGRPVKTKKTSMKKGNLAFPVFNDTFVFDVTNELMDKLSFVLAVCVYPRGSSKRVIGRVVVGPFMYATGDGLEHWKEMLLSPRHTVAKWHKLG